ncbi:MAG: FAD-binding protein, partial [Alphaproteobacteria bacterium]|nr:FAD-binding protein [Alphaproteobacteria bacterium]
VARAAVAKGLCYMPDPASRSASTIGGNIATDAGGARAARLGATGRHVLALKVVLIDGEVIDIGGGELEHAGLNVQALFSGGEGLIGVVVEATLRLMPPPAGIRLMLLGFPSMSGALSCAGAMSDAGITPRALELIDRQTAKVCEQFMPAGLPLEPEVLLAVEFEGESDELAEQSAAILRLADGYGTSQWLEITGPDEIARTWQSWGAALTALARLGPLRSTDIAVPPARLPSALAQIGEIAARYGLRGANLCRAGDGIIQSVLFYEPDDGDEEEGRVAAAMAEIAKTATEVGGAISAEHGIGVAKREMLELSFRPSDMALQSRLKSAFDPEWLLNHGKVFPLAEQTAAVAQPVQFGREQG